VESLARSSTAAVPFLLEVAGTSPDWRIRAGAVWAISTHEPTPQCGNILLDMVASEDDEVVRRRLYEALLVQPGPAGQRLLDSVLTEKDLPARIAGFNSVGAVVRTQKELAPAFDSRIVPELLKVALSENSIDLRIRAVFALRRAQTTTARTALAEISKASEQRVAQAARSGLQ
jgi:HEAT repeat protein